MPEQTYKYGAPMPRTPEEAFGPDGWQGPNGPPGAEHQRGVTEGIVEGRKQIYVWVLDGLKTLMPLLKLEFASSTLLHGFMYQLEKFSKTGRAPTNEDE